MVSLNVNRMARQFDGDPELPLLWYLLDELRAMSAGVVRIREFEPLSRPRRRDGHERD